MGRISPGGGGNAGNSANEESSSSRNRRYLPANDRQHHHQDPPVVPQIFDEHCDWVTPSRRNRGPLPVNDRTTPSIDNTISRTNSSGTVIPLNSRNRQIPVMPTFQGYNHSIVQHRGPLLMNYRHCQDPHLVPQIFEQALVHQIFDQPLVPQIFEQPLVPQIFEQPLVPQIFEQPFVPQIFDEHDNLLLESRLSHQHSISIANPNSGLPMLLNSQFWQVPSVPPFQGHNTNFVQDRVPNWSSYPTNNSSYLRIPNGRHHQFSRNFRQLDHGSQFQSSNFVQHHGPNCFLNEGGIPLTTRNFNWRRHQRRVSRNSEWSDHELQFHNGIIHESLRMRSIGQEEEDPTTTSIGSYSGLGVPILIPENIVVLQLPVVVVQVHDLRGEEHHSSDQRTTHLHGYSSSNRREHYHNNNHHSRRTLSSQVIDEHYIVHHDSQVHSSTDDGFDNITDDDHQHDIIEEHTYDVTSGLSEESILKYLNSRTIIKEPTTTSPLTDPCSSTSTTYNEICTICQGLKKYSKTAMV